MQLATQKIVIIRVRRVSRRYNPAMRDRGAVWNTLIALWIVYVLARVLQIFPLSIPTLLIVVLHVLPPAAFAVLHGHRLYGTRGVLVFLALCLGTATFFESFSLRTGFPFGHYYFTGVMGPKIFGLPILLALAYVGVGYMSWILANLIPGASARSRTGLVLLPVLASLIMTAWDLAMDPVWAYIDHAWVWRNGGSWYGVPLTNYRGWLLTSWVFYQAFALWLRRRTPVVIPLAWNRLAVLMYATTAAGNLLLAIPSALPALVPAVIAGPAGRHWSAADAVHSCILVSIFLMLPFALIAWLRAPNTSERLENLNPQPEFISHGVGV